VRSRRAAALFPAICDTGLPELISQAGYPSTRDLSSWHSIGTLLLAKCARKPRVSHAGTLADDAGLAFALGLTALPKTRIASCRQERHHRPADENASHSHARISCANRDPMPTPRLIRRPQRSMIRPRTPPRPRFMVPGRTGSSAGRCTGLGPSRHSGSTRLPVCQGSGGITERDWRCPPGSSRTQAGI
jgi:hypothetical protein